MNCSKCDYLLFGVADSRCPECGTGFETTDYAFEREAVHFLCPHCNQRYLGVDRHGLPHPRTFTCVKCNHTISAARMIVKPKREGALGTPLRFGTAWDHRERIGALRAFASTTAQVSLTPADFFRKTFLTDREAARAYGVVMSIIMGVVLLGLMLLWEHMLAPVLTGVASGGGVQLGRFMTPIWALMFVYFVLVLAWPYVFAVLSFAALRLMGHPETDFDGIIQVAFFGYAVLPAIVVLPPIGLAWYVWVLASGVRESQEIDSRRAMVASVLPLLAIANVVIAAVIL